MIAYEILLQVMKRNNLGLPKKLSETCEKKCLLLLSVLTGSQITS